MDIKEKERNVPVSHDERFKQPSPNHDNNDPQYCEDMHYPGEHHYNMNQGTTVTLGNVARAHHHAVVKGTLIAKTALTEKAITTIGNEDVEKAFVRTPKVHQSPQPNDFGNAVYPRLFKKSGSTGERKGGDHYHGTRKEGKAKAK